MTEDELRDTATDYIEQIIDVSSNWESGMHFVMAMLMQERELHKNALDSINEALKVSPEEFADYYHCKAEILLELDKPKDAMRSINKCIEIEEKNPMEEKNPQNPSSFMLKADVYHDLGKYKLAIDYSLKAIQMFKKQKIIKDPRQETLADAVYSIGHHYLHLKKYKESLKWLQKAEKQKPYDDTGQIAFDKADVLLNMKKYNEAGKAATKAVSLDVENGEYWLMLCYCGALAKKNSLDVLRALTNAHFLMPQPESERKRWIKEVKTITRYLKNADEDEIAKSAIKLKKKWQTLELVPEPSKKK